MDAVGLGTSGQIRPPQFDVSGRLRRHRFPVRLSRCVHATCRARQTISGASGPPPLTIYHMPLTTTSHSPSWHISC
ncbi:hypothetical protein, partial [Shewanella sp.]|uniref:hypothetical protein n=1 Tax=Shewanella sp. TaxID=50422 RepID=UPI0035626CDA